jgi:uncharacterized protein (DUF1697 family)
MKTYIALLRGINVSGKNIIKMNELIVHLSNLDYKNIRTYIQSGNIIFESDDKEIANFENEIHQLITSKFGLKVPVLVKSAEALKKVFENNPFVHNEKLDINKMHVTFLSETPDKENIVELVESKIEADEFILNNDVVYLYCGNGYGNTKLNNTFFEKKLKVSATTRNWKTVCKLRKMSAL